MTVVNDENKKLLHKNKILVLDYFFDKVNMLLWPRFSQLFDSLIENARKANLQNFKLYNQTSVHSSAIRYAEVVRSLTMIAPYLSQDMLSLKLGSYRSVFIEFLSQLANAHFQEGKERRSFMINNLDFIINTLRQSPSQEGLCQIELELY